MIFSQIWIIFLFLQKTIQTYYVVKYNFNIKSLTTNWDLSIMFFSSEFQNIYIDYQESPNLQTEDNEYKSKFYQYWKLNEDVELKLEDILLYFSNFGVHKVISFSNWCGLYHYVEEENPKEFFLLTDESKPYFGKLTQEIFARCIENGTIKRQIISSELND